MAPPSSTTTTAAPARRSLVVVVVIIALFVSLFFLYVVQKRQEQATSASAQHHHRIGKPSSSSSRSFSSSSSSLQHLSDAEQVLGNGNNPSAALAILNPFSPMCHLSKSTNEKDGGCKPNPHWFAGRREKKTAAGIKQRHSNNSDVINEYHCDSPLHKQREKKRFRDAQIKARGERGDGDGDANENFVNFKKLTSWMFNKHYDWSGRCHNPSNSSSGSSAGSDQKNSNDDGVIRGRHINKEAYKLENFCLKPMGRLTGHWNSQQGSAPVDDFFGTTEAFRSDGAAGSREEGLVDFLSVKNIDFLPEKPKCFRDTRLILFPITVQSGNVGHALHRAGSLLRYIETVFGGETTDRDHPLQDVTVVYVVTQYGYHEKISSSPELNEACNVQKYFFDLLGTSWFSIFSFNRMSGGVREAWKDVLARKFSCSSSSSSSSSASSASCNFFDDDAKLASLMDTPICFREGYVWHNAHQELARNDHFEASSEEIGKRLSYHLFGKRSMRDVATLNVLNDKIRSCRRRQKQQQRHLSSSSQPLSVPSSDMKRREQVNRENPHVIFVVRSKSRRFSLQPHLINVIADFVSSELRGTFEVIEHIHLDFDEIIERFSRADILIGMLGAGLIWTELMPPGAILIEFNMPTYRCANIAGVNTNPRCDFGGAAAAAQQYHVAIANSIDALNRFSPDIDKMVEAEYRSKAKTRRKLPVIRNAHAVTDVAVGASLMKWTLEKAKCLLEHSEPVMKLSSRVLQPVPAQCQFRKAALDAAVLRDIADEDGDSLAAFVRMNLLAASSLSSSSSSSSSSSTSSSFMSVQRMYAMLDHRRQVSKAISKLRIADDRTVTIRAMLVVPALLDVAAPEEEEEEQGPSNCAALLKEIQTWRMILRDVYRFVVVVVPTGMDGQHVDGKAKKQDKKKSKPMSSLFCSSTAAGNDKSTWHGVEFCEFPCSSSTPLATAAARDFGLVIRSTFVSVTTVRNNNRDRNRELATRREFLQSFLMPAENATMLTFVHHRNSSGENSGENGSTTIDVTHGDEELPPPSLLPDDDDGNGASLSSQDTDKSSGNNNNKNNRPTAKPKARYGGHHLEPPLTHFAKLGLDPNYFYSPKCHVSTTNVFDGGCKKNPWYKPGRSSDAARVAEFQCPERKPSDRRALLDNGVRDSTSETTTTTEDSPTTTTTKHFREFKQHASWMFEKFYDWNPKCTTRYTDGHISGKANSARHKHIYELENFCLKPMGRLSGYWPKGQNPSVQQWPGTHEAYSVNGGARGVDPGMLNFLRNIERLEEKPSCFLDVNLVLHGITVHGSNVGHSIHRFASMLRLIETTFGGDRNASTETTSEIKNSTASEVTIGYIVTDKGFGYTSTPEANSQLNVMRYFYDMLGSSWFSVFSQNIPQVRDAWWGAASGPLTPHERNKILNRPICFRRAYVWHNAEEAVVQSDLHNRRHFISRPDEPGRRHSFHLFGQRSMRDVETLNLLNRRMRQCPAPPIPERRLKPNKNHPHVILLIRSAHRRFSLQPHITNVIGEYVEKEMHGTFEVLEHIGLDVDEVIERFSKADVLIGALGAGLLWFDFMPPGGVVVEITPPGYRCAERTGINQNGGCDFGGSAAVAQLFHLSVANNNEGIIRLPQYYEKGRRHGGSHTDFAGGRIFFRWLLDRVKCVLAKGKVDRNEIVQSIPQDCQFTAGDLAVVTKKDVEDHDGSNLAAFVQMYLPPAAERRNSSETTNSQSMIPADAIDDEEESVARMKLMIKNKEMLSAALKPFRYTANRGVFHRLLVLLKCAPTTKKGYMNLLGEINAWRGILRDLYPATVFEFSAVDKKSCPPAVDAAADRDGGTASSSLRIGANDGVTWHGIRVCRFPSCGKNSQQEASTEYNIVVRSSLHHHHQQRDGGDDATSDVRTRDQQAVEWLQQNVLAASPNGKIFSFDDDLKSGKVYVQDFQNNILRAKGTRR